MTRHGFSQAEALDARRAERMLLRLAMAFGLAAAAFLLAGQFDDRALDNGHGVWAKPQRFSLAFSLHLATLYWLARLTQRQAAGDRWFATSAWLQAGTAVLELGCITLQAARGVHSHFNYATAFDHAIFTLMGLGTAVLLAGLLLMVAGLLRWPADRLATTATVTGLSIAVLGGLVGVWMVMPTVEQRDWIATGLRLPWVGSAWTGPPSAQVLPFFGWDRQTGDWRVPHFIGLHAMQAVPALAWLQRRGKQPAAPAWPPALRVGTAAYLAAFAGALVWTASGRSVLDASAGSALLVGLPLAVFLAAAGLLLYRRVV